MLKKRSSSFQQDQYKSHLMSDSSSDISFQPVVLGQKNKSSSFFSLPGLLLGFSIKGVSDSDSVRSPTSPLDYKFLTNLGKPFRSPRANQDGSQRSWNCSKVGLGIVDSLNDETKPPGRIVRLSKSKSVMFGSQMRINIPYSPNYLNGRIVSSGDHSMSTKSLPKDYAIAPHTQINFPALQLMGTENSFGTGEIQLEPKKFGRIRSYLSDFGKPLLPLTSLAYCDPILDSENFCSDEKTSSGSQPINGGEADFNNFLGMKLGSIPISLGSIDGKIGNVSASEIELSEDYTRIISHGSSPKTTHIFGDCILECHDNELASCIKKDEHRIESHWIIKCMIDSFPKPSEDFLSSCYLCKKKLEEGEDIYMYRGDKAFCSTNCRALEILVDEAMENDENNSTNNDSTEPTCSSKSSY